MPQHGAEPSLSASLSSTPRGLPARVHHAGDTERARLGQTAWLLWLLVVVVVVVCVQWCVCFLELATYRSRLVLKLQTGTIKWLFLVNFWVSDNSA